MSSITGIILDIIIVIFSTIVVFGTTVHLYETNKTIKLLRGFFNENQVEIINWYKKNIRGDESEGNRKE